MNPASEQVREMDGQLTGTHLDTIATVDLDFAFIILPKDAELDDTFVLGVFLEEGLEGRGDFVDGSELIVSLVFSKAIYAREKKTHCSNSGSLGRTIVKK